MDMMMDMMDRSLGRFDDALWRPTARRPTPFADAARARMGARAWIADKSRATPCVNVDDDDDDDDDDDGVGSFAGEPVVARARARASAALCFHDELMREATRAVREVYAMCDDARDADGHREASSKSTSVETEAKAYCTSCKRQRDAREDFYPDRKTCKPCLDRHQVNSMDFRARMARKRRRNRGGSRRRR